MTFDEFMKQPIKYDGRADELELWDSRSFKEQMQDIYGEAFRVVKSYSTASADLEKQWSVFDMFCNMTYLAPRTTVGERETLKIAAWEIYDYVFGKNEFKNDSKTVMRWFNQWVFDLNYSAISEG